MPKEKEIPIVMAKDSSFAPLPQAVEHHEEGYGGENTGLRAKERDKGDKTAQVFIIHQLRRLFDRGPLVDIIPIEMI